MQSNTQQSAPKKHTSIWVKLLKYGVPPLITVGLCYVLFHNQDIPGMIAYVRNNCDFAWILASMGLTVLSLVIRAMRWRIQLRASSVYAPLKIVTYSIVGTYAVNLVFPRLGEIWRSEYIARRESAPFTTVLGSMVADRLADTATVLLLLLATFFIAGDAVEGFIDKYPSAYHAISNAISSPVTYIIIAAFIGFGIWFMRHRWSGKRLLRVQRLFKNLFSGLTAIFHMKGAWKWGVLTVILWTTYFCSLLCCFMAFGFTRDLFLTHGLLAVFVCYVLSSIAMGVPSNGGIGPYQAALIFALGFFIIDLNTNEALGFANTVLGAQIVTIILCGIPTFIAILLDQRRHARQMQRQANAQVNN